MGTLAKRRAQVITSKSRVQINLTQASEIIYNKILQFRVYNPNLRVQHSGSKTEFKTET